MDCILEMELQTDISFIKVLTEIYLWQSGSKPLLYYDIQYFEQENGQIFFFFMKGCSSLSSSLNFF